MTFPKGMVTGSLVLAFAFSTHLGAQVAQERTVLKNFDQRLPTAATAELLASRSNAVNALAKRVPGLRVDHDAVLGTAKSVGATRGFLTGPNGQGGGLSAVHLNARPANDPHRVVKAFLDEHAALFGHGSTALNSARVQRDFTGAHNGMHSVVWQQEHAGIDVFEATLNAHTTRRGELISLSSHLVSDVAKAADAGTPNHGAVRNRPPVSAAQAVVFAAHNVGEELEAATIVASGGPPTGTELRQNLNARPRLTGDTDARLVWLPLDSSRLRLCWEIVLTSRQRGEMFKLLVEAQTGEVLVRHCLTDYISPITLNVYTSDSPTPFSPGWPSPNTNQPPYVPRTLLTLSALSTNASPAGWIPDGGNETLGNNVDAHTDHDANNSPDLPRPQGSPARTFDFPIDFSQHPSNFANASAVQLFYWANWYHDKLYDMGFTEAAGNFQSNNFGRGGQGNDAIQADAQDGSGINNANFSTPSDGSPGRVQMFYWNGPNPPQDGDLDAEVVLHELTHGTSNRRVGGGVGLSASQSQGMGEGWSDWYGLALLAEAGDNVDGVWARGAYSRYLLSGLTANYYYGGRRYPYCTDLGINPLTFKDIDPAQASTHPGVLSNPINPMVPANAAEVHAQGEVWCSALWECRANLIRKYGFAGNQILLQMVTDGLPLTPANPTFLQARDAIIQADLVNKAGANRFELWSGFAKRGMGYSATSPASSTTSGVVEAFDIPDDLGIAPNAALVFSGFQGSTLNPACQSFTLTNSGSNSLTWTAAVGSNWLSVSPDGGTLAAGGGVTVDACLTPGANALPAGNYSLTIAFSNQTSTAVQMRVAQLRVIPVFTLPFTETFETGSLSPNYAVTGTGTFRSQVVSSNTPHDGLFHLTMDDSNNSTTNSARNEVTFGVNLAGYTNAVLRFWAKGFNDEASGPPPTPFTNGFDFDGVAIGTDGTTWFEIQGLRTLTASYAEYVVNLDAAAAAFGIGYSAPVLIRFNHFDDQSIPNDGIGIDDITITAEVPGVPAIYINDVSQNEGNSGTSNMLFTARLSQPATNIVTVNFATQDTTALAGADYLATNGLVTFLPGETNQPVTVTILGDLLNETNESFRVIFSNPVNATLADTQAIGTIVNDDPLPTLQFANATYVEGNVGTNSVVFNVNLSAPSGRTVSVNYATASNSATAGVDYVTKSGTLTFAAGVTNTNIVLSIISEILIETNENFRINFTTPVFLSLTNSQATVTIINDDGLPGELYSYSWSLISSPQPANVPFPVTITALDASNNPASNYTGPAILMGQLPATNLARFDFETGLQGFAISNMSGTTNGLWHLSTGRANNPSHSPSNSLYYGTNETVTGGGTYNTGANAGSVVSPVIDLTAVAGPLTLSFNYLMQTEATTSFDNGFVEVSTDGGATWALLVGTSQSSPLLVKNTSGVWLQTSIDLSAYAGRQIRLRFRFDTVDSVSNAFEGWYLDDITIAKAAVTVPIAPVSTGSFTNGIWAGLINVPQPETNMVLVASDGNGHTNASNPFDVVAQNTLTINNASVVEGNSGTATLSFAVTLTPSAAFPVSVNFATADGTATAGSDYISTNGALAFAPGETAKTVTVTVMGDTLTEPNETVLVVLSGAAGAYLGDGTGIGTILNDDGGAPLATLPRNDFWIANNTVNAVLETNGVIYLGGTFTEMGVTNIGRLAPFDPNTGEVLPGFPLVDQTVNAVLDDGSGGWFIGGSFTSVGGIPRFRLAHILANLTVDTNFSANCSSTVNALARDATNLYVGGGFTLVTNGVTGFSRTFFAVVDPITGTIRSYGNNPSFNSSVFALTVRSNMVYVGGNFTSVTVGGTNFGHPHLAALDAGSGAPTAWQADVDNVVNALALGSNALYAGGSFTVITNGGLQPRYRFAALDLATGAPTAPVAHFNSTVQSLLVNGSNIYVGGFFTAVTNGATAINRSNLVVLDAISGAVSAWQPAANGVVRAMAIDGTNLVAGGDFLSIGGQADRRRLAVVSTVTGVATSFDPDVGASVNAVSVRSNFVYAGGAFNFAKGTARNRLAAVDAVTGALLPWNPNANSTVLVLAGHGSNIYAGGLFSAFTNGVTVFVRNRIAALDASSGAVVTNFAPTVGNIVRALAVAGSNLYVGGDFTNVTVAGATNVRQGLAAVDLTNGSVRAGFVTGISPVASLTTNITALAVADGTLYVGGAFTGFGGQPRFRIAAVDTATGALTAWNPNLNGTVQALLANGNNVIAGGAFTVVTNGVATTTRNRLVALDTYAALPTAWNPNASSSVNALATRGTNLYAGGLFTTIGGLSRSAIVELDGTLASSSPTAWNPNATTTVNALFANTNRLLVGGSSAAVGTQPIPFLATFQPDVGPVVTASGGALTYTENDDPTPVDPGINIVDPDGPSIANVAVRITGNLQPQEDVLGLTPVGGITGAYVPSSGTLLLTGQSTLANYLLALRSVTYSNRSDAPSILPRTVQFIVNDGISNSPPASRTVNVVPVNDAPTLSQISPQITVENRTTGPIPFTIGDAESGPSNLVLSAVSTNGVLFPLSNIVFGGSGSNRTVTVTPGTNQAGVAILLIYASDNTNFNNTGFELTVLADSDGDGIPDFWETLFGLNPNDPGDAALDFDGDGLTNLQEYLAGTDPNDSRNYLGIVAVTIDASDALIAFSSVYNKLYRVERTDDVASGVWTTVAENVPGTSDTVTITDSGAAQFPQRAYRVRLLP